MKRFRVSIRALSILATIAMVVLVLPLILTAFYNRPILDDLVQPYPAAAAYRQTGSIIQAFGAAIGETVRIWHAYSGIFSSMFISVFAPFIVNYTYSFIHPILLTIFTIIAVYQAAKCLHLVNKEIPAAYLWLITMVVSIMLLTTMPSVYEGFYWYSAAMNYTFFFMFSLLLFSCLIKSIHHQPQKHGRRIWSHIIYCVCFFILGGANWMTSTYSIVVYGFLAIWILLRNKPKTYLLPMLFLVMGYLLAIAAPGNTARQAVVGERLPLIETFLTSFRYAFTYCTKNWQYYLIGLLLVPVFFHLKRFIPKLPKYLLLTPLCSICILAAAYFPLVYSAYSITDRHVNIIFFLFSILLVINEAVLVFWIAEFIPRLLPKKDDCFFPGVLLAVAVVTLSMLGFYRTSISLSPLDVNCNYAPALATIHLVKGYSKNYAGSYDHLVHKLQTTEEDVMIVDTFMSSPLFGTPDLQLDPASWINEGFVKFHTDKDILLTQPRNLRDRQPY